MTVSFIGYVMCDVQRTLLLEIPIQRLESDGGHLCQCNYATTTSSGCASQLPNIPSKSS